MRGTIIRPGTLWTGPRLLGAALLCSLLYGLGTSPAFAAPAWLPATNLSVPGKNANDSAVAMDEAGETVAVWERKSETEISDDVQASTRSPGADFGAAVNLSGAASEPDVAMTPSGEAVAVWRHFDLSDEGDYVIQASFRPPGGSFSTPIEVAVTPNSALPQDLHVAVNAAGDAAVVWIQQDPTSGLEHNPTFVDAAVRPAGGSFSEATTISPQPLVSGQSARSPRLAIDPAGDVTAVWEYFDGTDEVIQAATRHAGGSFASPEGLTADGEEAFEPDIALDSAGVATVAWDQFKEPNYTIEASSSPSGGSFGMPLDLSSASPATLGAPAIAMTPAGLATVAWTQFNATNNIVQAASGSVGGGFSAPVDLSASDQEALYPEVAVDPAGTATVVWKGSNGSNDIVEASTDSPGGSFTAPVELSAVDQNSVFPKVAMDGAGDATAVWSSASESNESDIVEAAGYDADAPVLRSLSIPTSGTVGTPVSFSADPFDVWPISSTTFNFGDGAKAEGTSVSHTYSAPGTYQVTVTSTDAAGTPVAAEGTIGIIPSSEFAIDKLTLNKKRGTGILTLTVPGPGKLVLSGKAVHKATKRPRGAGEVKLPVKARGKDLKSLRKRGKARVSLAIAFTPNGGTTFLKHTSVTLIVRPRR